MTGEIVASAENLFRARIASGVSHAGRVELAEAARELARTLLPVDVPRAVLLFELAELVVPSFVRTFH